MLKPRTKPLDGSVFYQVNPNGQREGLICLECKAAGRPWVQVTCEHVLSAPGGIEIPKGSQVIFPGSAGQ